MIWFLFVGDYTGYRWRMDYCGTRVQAERPVRRPFVVSEQEVILPNLAGSGDAETKIQLQDLLGVEGRKEKNRVTLNIWPEEID